MQSYNGIIRNEKRPYFMTCKAAHKWIGESLYQTSLTAHFVFETMTKSKVKGLWCVLFFEISLFPMYTNFNFEYINEIQLPHLSVFEYIYIHVYIMEVLQNRFSNERKVGYSEANLWHQKKVKNMVWWTFKSSRARKSMRWMVHMTLFLGFVRHATWLELTIKKL